MIAGLVGKLWQCILRAGPASFNTSFGSNKSKQSLSFPTVNTCGYCKNEFCILIISHPAKGQINNQTFLLGGYAFARQPAL